MSEVKSQVRSQRAKSSFVERASNVLAKGSFFQNFVDQEEEIQNAKGSFMGTDFQAQASQIRESFARHQPKNSSSTTIFAIVNLMVGSIVLLIPVNFGSSGIIASFLIMTVIGAISWLTCLWIVDNSKDYETDVSQVLSRILGNKWSILFTFSSSILVFCVSIVFFLLINQTFWQMTEFVFEQAGYKDYANQDELIFDKYSIQWQCFWVMVLLFPLLQIKNPQFIVKLAGFGTIALYVYIAFIFYIFFQNIYEGNLNSENMKSLDLFPPDIKTFGAIIGNFAVAFMCHNGITNITSSNKTFEKNSRDTTLAYIVAFCVYLIIGLIGCLGLVGRVPYQANPDLIYGYFSPSNVVSFIVECIFIVNLSSVFPLLVFISRSQFFTVALQNKKTPPKYSLAFNIFLSMGCLLVLIFNVNIDTVIGIAGNAIGYIIVYLTPSALIYEVKFGKKRRNSALKDQSLKTITEEEAQYLYDQSSQGTAISASGEIQETLLEKDNGENNQNSAKDILLKIFLVALNAIGLGFAVISIVIIFI